MTKKILKNIIVSFLTLGTISAMAQAQINSNVGSTPSLPASVGSKTSISTLPTDSTITNLPSASLGISAAPNSDVSSATNQSQQPQDMNKAYQSPSKY